MDTYERIVSLFDSKNVPYRVIEHPPEGQTDKASEIRGHALEQAAKAIVAQLKTEVAEKRFVLAVVPGDRRIDMKRLAALFGAKKASFAASEEASVLTGCVMGSVPPLSFTDRMVTVFDKGLSLQEEIFFNAGRLDRSIALNTRHFLDATAPSLAEIAGETA